MNAKPLIVLSLLVLAGSAIARQDGFSVEVRAEAATRPSLVFQCAKPALPSPLQVEQILGIKDNAQTAALRSKLMNAVGEACTAGVAKIQVARGANGGSLRWEAAEG